MAPRVRERGSCHPLVLYVFIVGICIGILALTTTSVQSRLQWGCLGKKPRDFEPQNVPDWYEGFEGSAVRYENLKAISTWDNRMVVVNARLAGLRGSALKLLQAGDLYGEDLLQLTEEEFREAFPIIGARKAILRWLEFLATTEQPLPELPFAHVGGSSRQSESGSSTPYFNDGSPTPYLPDGSPAYSPSPEKESQEKIEEPPVFEQQVSTTATFPTESTPLPFKQSIPQREEAQVSFTTNQKRPEPENHLTITAPPTITSTPSFVSEQPTVTEKISEPEVEDRLQEDHVEDLTQARIEKGKVEAEEISLSSTGTNVAVVSPNVENKVSIDIEDKEKDEKKPVISKDKPAMTMKKDPQKFYEGKLELDGEEKDKVVRVPLVITHKSRKKLFKLGYTPLMVRYLAPERAHVILDYRIRCPKDGIPDSWRRDYQGPDVELPPMTMPKSSVQPLKLFSLPFILTFSALKKTQQGVAAVTGGAGKAVSSIGKATYNAGCSVGNAGKSVASSVGSATRSATVKVGNAARIVGTGGVKVVKAGGYGVVAGAKYTAGGVYKGVKVAGTGVALVGLGTVTAAKACGSCVKTGVEKTVGFGVSSVKKGINFLRSLTRMQLLILGILGATEAYLVGLGEGKKRSASLAEASSTASSKRRGLFGN